MNNDYIISYDQGYTDWYVSEFYKFFHKKLEKTLNITFTYEPLDVFANRFNHTKSNHTDSLFNWYNLIIYNKKTGKLFAHSWYDYADSTVEWCVKEQLNVVKFSAVSNINSKLLAKYSFVSPSVYLLENWSDHTRINNYKNSKKTIQKIYFAGLDHGIRTNILTVLRQFEYFDLYTKSTYFKQKEKYYNELSRYHYGLSLNGAANICYRDLELFGIGVLNLRQNLNVTTHDPLVEGIHYIKFLSEEVIQNILEKSNNVEKEINDKIEYVKQIINSPLYSDTVQQAQQWFNKNCTPDNQFHIISSLLEELTILN